MVAAGLQWPFEDTSSDMKLPNVFFSIMHHPRVGPGGPSSLSCVPPSFTHMIHPKVGVASPLPPCIKKEFSGIETCLNSTRLDGSAQLV
jgi:hypothetical protein